MRREALDRLLRDLTLTTLASAIALGWAVFEVGSGLADSVTGLMKDYAGDPDLLSVAQVQPLTWRVFGDHILAVRGLVEGLIELAVVLAVVVAVYHRRAGDGGEAAAGRASNDPTR